MKIKQKEYKTFEEQISLLKKRNLNIKNKQRLLSYLKLYNYQVFINGYNDPFMKNFQRITDKFQENVSEDSLITLFNFDRAIAPILLTNIQNIERKFSTMVTHIIAKKLFDNDSKYGEILKFENFKKIFSRCKKNDDLKNSLCGEFERAKTDLKNKYYSEQNDYWIETVPIWTLSVYWSFGDVICIFQNLSADLKGEVLNSAFSKIFLDDREFLRVIYLLKSIRNRICHNNVIYNTKIKNNAKELKEFLKRHNKKTTRRIAIYDVVNMIDILLPDSGLKNIFDEKVDKRIIRSEYLSVDIRKNILDKMNYIKDK